MASDALWTSARNRASLRCVGRVASEPGDADQDEHEQHGAGDGDRHRVGDVAASVLDEEHRRGHEHRAPDEDQPTAVVSRRVSGGRRSTGRASKDAVPRRPNRCRTRSTRCRSGLCSRHVPVRFSSRRARRTTSSGTRLPASSQNATGRRPPPTASRTAIARSATSPTGYAIEARRSTTPRSSIRTYGAMSRTHETSPRPAVMMAASMMPARSRPRDRRWTSTARPAINSGYIGQVHDVDVRGEQRLGVLRRDSRTL